MALVGFGLLVLGLLILLLIPRFGKASEGSADQFASAIPAQVNFDAPELVLADLEGKTAALSDYQGSVVLVNNWATWCPPCKAEMPTLQAYFEDHQAQGFTIIAIEAGEPVEEVSRFANDYKLTFPVWVDRDMTALDAFHNDSLPNSYVIDRRGVVRLAWAGAISQETLEKYITPLLEE